MAHIYCDECSIRASIVISRSQRQRKCSDLPNKGTYRIKYGATAGTISQVNLNAATCSGIDVFLDGNPSGGSGVFVGGASLHTWTKVPNIDPEFSYTVGNFQGVEFAALPNARTVGLSFRITP